MDKPTIMTIPAVIENSVNKFANKNALVDLDVRSITYSELKEKAESISSFLKDIGIAKGDKVAILGENRINWGVAYIGIVSIGAIAVPIMTEFQESEVHHVIRHSQTKAIFVSSKYFEKVETLNLDDLKTKILIDDFSIIPSNTSSDFLKQAIEDGKKEFNKIKIAALKFVGLLDEKLNEDDLALILYTSGTTGHSKGVMLTHKNVVYDAYATTKLVSINKNDRLLSILPLFHTIESTLGFLTMLMEGAEITYLAKPPTATILLPALKKVKPTIMISVPLVIEKIYKLRILPEIRKKAITRNLYKLPFMRKKINSVAGKKLYQTFGGELKMFCIGGAAISAEVERFLKEGSFPYAMGYGLTETSPLVTGTGPEAVSYRACGVPLIGMEVKIDNPDPVTDEGEVLIKGPNVMLGYYKDKEKTNEVFTEDGWFRSGDLGKINKAGYLFIKGRSKNVIIGSNGKNIYPEEIESIINEQKYVLESLVLSSGDQLVAKVHFNYEEIDNDFEIENLDESEARKILNTVIEDLHKFLNENISSFSRINKIVEQVSPFEKTPTQKIKRFLYT